MCKAKFFNFFENYSPPFYGLWPKRSSTIKGRKLFSKDEYKMNYKIDSDDKNFGYIIHNLKAEIKENQLKANAIDDRKDKSKKKSTKSKIVKLKQQLNYKVDAENSNDKIKY